eukprot:2508795-Amphidinium_carterae.1
MKCVAQGMATKACCVRPKSFRRLLCFGVMRESNSYVHKSALKRCMMHRCKATIQSGKWWEQKDALRRRIARLYGLRLPLYERSLCKCEALYNEVAEIAKELDVQLPPWEGTLVFAASHKLSQSSGG